MQRLEFTLESDGTYNYLIYLSSKLDITINEKMYDSFSATATRKLYINRIPKDTNKMLISEYICSRINDVLDSYWDVETYGIPVINIVGDTTDLDQEFRNRQIIIYTLGCRNYNCPEAWVTDINKTFSWPNDNIIFLSRYGSNIRDSYNVIANTVDFTTAWLDKMKYINTTSDSPESKLVKLMRNWYKDVEYDTLVKLSEQAITDFVVTGKINIYIPGYLTVHSYHIKRYKKALDTIENIYNPKFVMTIPIYRGNTSFTVMFPICENITSDTVRR